MRIITAILLSIAFLSFGFSTAQAQDKISIVATVGEEAITNIDLINRMKVTIISSGLDSTPEVIAQIKPKVLQSLINEKLQSAEAKRLGYEITQAEIENALSSVEKQNNMPSGGLTKLLVMNNIPASTMEDQIRGEISWAKIRNAQVRPRVKISEEEIDDFLNAKSLSSVKTEYYLNEIVIPVDETSEEAESLALANRLRSQIIDGKSFAAIAQEFSQSATARNGGVVGWLSENQIPKEIKESMSDNNDNLRLEEVSQPIRSIEGYFLIKATDKREVESNADRHFVTLRQFSTKPKNPKKESSVKAAFDRISKVNNPVKACLDSKNYAESKNAALTDFGEIRIRELSPAVKNVVVMLETGKISSPIRGGVGVSVFIVCEKTEDIFQQMDSEERDKANRFLSLRKIELFSRKYMRDLRSRTNIETRI